MAKNKVICTTNNVEYIQIRKAMIQGARTVEEVQNIVGQWKFKNISLN